MRNGSHKTARTTGDGPFFWVSKSAARKIREAFDSEQAVTTALATYCALAEIASDEQSESFQTTHAWISSKCGVSPRTVRARIKELATIGIIEVSTPALKAPSTYRLLADRQPLPNVAQPLPNDRQRMVFPPLPPLEESKKNKEESQEECRRNGSATASESDSDWLESLKRDSAYDGIDVGREHAKMCQWCQVNHRKPTRRRFVNWLHRVDKPMSAPTPTSPTNGRIW